MRRAKFLKRRRHLFQIVFIFFFVLMSGFYIYLNLRGELLLRDFKIFVEKGLSQVLKAKVSIGDIKGGIFYPITFSDMVLYNSPKGEYKLLEADNIKINYRVWDLFFNHQKDVYRMTLVSPQFFILPEKYRRDTFSMKEKSFFNPHHVELDIIRGSIFSYSTEDFIVKNTQGRIILSQNSADLKNVALNFYGLPVVVDGKVNGLYSDSPDLDITLESKNDYVKLTADVERSFKALGIKGSLELADRGKTDFSGFCEFYEDGLKLKDTILGSTFKIDGGYLDFSNKDFNFILSSQEANSSGEIRIKGDFSLPDISLYMDIRHWDINGLDITTNVELETEIKQKAKTNVFTGTLNTANTIVNYRPCEELSLQFVLRKKAIEILGFEWGRVFRTVGKLELDSPYNVEVITLLDGAKLEEFTFFGGSGAQNIISGAVKGRLEIEGPLANCVSRGHITSKNGHIGNVYYENATIHFVGKGPLITMGDSRIYRETGYLILSGEIDLRKLGKRNIFENIIVKTDDQTIVWEGWDITKEPSADKVTLKKRINEELEIGFKAPLENGYALPQEDKEGEVELRYKLKEHESLKMQLKEEEEFLGVEHRIKF